MYTNGVHFLHLFSPDILNLGVAVAFTMRTLLRTPFQDGRGLNSHCFAFW